MENLYLQDGTDIKIEEGTGISRIITYVDSYPALGELAAELTRDNLSDMQIGAEGAAGTGAYRDMALTEPHFRITDQGERLKVVFGLRQLTEQELKAPSVAAAAAYLTDEQALTVKDLYPAYEYGKLYEELHEYIKHLDCRYNVILIKSIDNPFPILKRCDLSAM